MSPMHADRSLRLGIFALHYDSVSRKETGDLVDGLSCLFRAMVDEKARAVESLPAPKSPCSQSDDEPVEDDEDSGPAAEVVPNMVPTAVSEWPADGTERQRRCN